MTDIIYWDDVSDPANPGWLLRTDNEDVPLDTRGDEDMAAAEAAKWLGWDAYTKKATDDNKGWQLHQHPTAVIEGCEVV